MSDSTKKSKNYIKGSAKQVIFDNGGDLINVDLKLEDLQKIANERGYVRIVVAPLRSTDSYGNTHSIYENDFVPKKQAEGDVPRPKPVQAKLAITSGGPSGTGTATTNDTRNSDNFPF